MIYNTKTFSSVINGRFYYDVFRDDLELILHIINTEEFKTTVANIVIDDYNESEFRNKRKRSRLSYARSKNLMDSAWGRLISDPNINNPRSMAAKKFKRRFRLPFELFEAFVNECIENNVFKTNYKTKITVKFRVLIALRMLGRSSLADDIEEALNIGESTCYTILKQFVEGCYEKLVPKYVKEPTNEKLNEIGQVYSRYL